MLISEHYYQMPHHLHMRKEKLLKDKYTEALAAVQAMKNNKSPGPDGYTSQFYKYFLETQEIFLFAQSIMDFKMKRCQ